MAKYQQYAEYKDSGVEWLGEIPSHWDVIKGGYIGALFGSETVLESHVVNEGDLPFIKVSTLSTDGFNIDSPKWFVSRKVDRFFRTQEDYIVFPKRGAAIFTNKVNIVNIPSVIDPNLMGWKVNEKAISKYIALLLKTRRLDDIADVSTVPQINNKHINPQKFPLPPIEEQKLILKFLDHETAQIDTLIEKQQILMQLLKEKRQAVISHAVTKGLNPDAPMKDSGVEWLGEVPKHWEVCKIQYYAKIESGHTPSKTKEKYWENCTIPWISLNDSKQLRVVDYISDTAFEISELGLANSSARILPRHSVVFTRDASIGLSAITTKEMAVSQHIIAWLPIKQKLSPEFLLLIFYGMEKEFDRYTFGSTIKTIGMDNVRSLTAAFPSLIEQKIIVEQCFIQLKTIDKIIEESDALLTILRERRIALISAAVTGKIDVRGWVAPDVDNLK